MKFLAYLVRGLHLSLGISTPKPEQEAFFVLFWLAVFVLLMVMFGGLLYVMKHVPL